MIIAIGSDHGGYELKEYLKEHLKNKGIDTVDFGCDGQSCDYPDIAAPLAKAVAEKKYDCGILCCGTGLGIGIAANKVKGIRAATVSEPVSARLTKEHNNANILCLGGRVTGTVLAAECVDAWLSAEFCGGRHQDRIDKISSIENSR